MLDERADELRDLPGSIARLGQAKMEINRVFQLLADKLPNVSREIGQFGAALASLRSQASRAEMARTIESVQLISRDLCAQLAADRANSEEMLSGTSELIRTIDVMTRTLDGLDSLAARLRMTGFNASFAGLLNDAKAAALAALSRELVSLTADTTKEAQTIRNLSNQVRQEAGKVGELQAKLGQGLQKIGEAQEGLHQAADRLLESLNGLGETLAEAGSRTEVSREGIRKIMLSIQNEDVLRQGIEHVLLSLEELDACSQALEKLPDSTLSEERLEMVSFQEQVSAACPRMLEEATSGVGVLFDGVLEELEGLRRTAGALTTLDDRLAGAEGLRACIADPVRSLRAALEIVETGDASKGFLGCASTLESLVLELRRRLAALEGIAYQLGMIKVMANVEIAQTQVMTGATYFIGEVGEARGKFGSFVQEVERSLGDLQRAIERLEQQRRRAVRQERLALLLDLMSRRAEEIDELAGGFLLGIERAIAVGERLMSSAVDSRDRLGEGRSRLLQPEELQAIRALCALRAGAALRERARLGPAGVETPGDSRPRTRFKALLGQFKVLSYKTIAGQAAGVEVESGGQGGELTLF